MSTTTHVNLEPAAQAFADAAATAPFLADLGPEEGRRALRDVQGGDIEMPPADITRLDIPGGPTGSVSVRIVRPAGVRADLPAVLYIHGAGWVFGEFETHERLVREIAVGTDAAVVFVEYTRSPEARYPVALEECFHVAEWIHEYGYEAHLDRQRIAVAGDSVGGNLAAGVTQLASAAEGPSSPLRHSSSGHRRELRHLVVPGVRDRVPPATRRDAVVLGPVRTRLGQPRGDHSLTAAGDP